MKMVIATFVTVMLLGVTAFFESAVVVGISRSMAKQAEKQKVEAQVSQEYLDELEFNSRTNNW